MARDRGSWLNRLVGACLSLLVGAVALSLAVSIVRPYLDLLVGVVVVAMTLLAGWRRWQHRR